MLVDLAEDLRRGVQFALARDIAAVRDLVRLKESRWPSGAIRACRPLLTS
jgi:hypothetical protein